MIAPVPRRRPTPVWPWWMVLAVLVHLAGCAHGPLPSEAGRVDALPVQAAVASHPSRDAAEVVFGGGVCERHHGGVQACAGVDEPAVGQPQPAREPLAQSAVLVSGVDGRVAPVRGPPYGMAAGSGPGRARAVLQVWRA